MTDVTLGHFGDRRLEKGGSFCIGALWRREGVGCGFAGWVGTGRARSGCFAFCTIRR